MQLPLPEGSRITAVASKLVKNHLQRIVDKDMSYHLQKRPNDKKDIEDVANGWYGSIDKQKKEGIPCLTK